MTLDGYLITRGSKALKGVEGGNHDEFPEEEN